MLPNLMPYRRDPCLMGSMDTCSSSDSVKIGAARLFAGPEISSSIYGLRTKSVGNAFVPFTIYLLCCLLIP